MSLVEDALKALPAHSTPEIDAAHDYHTQMLNLPALHRQRMAEATATGDVQAVADLASQAALHPVQAVAAALALYDLLEAHYDASISQMTDQLAELQPVVAAATLAVKEAEDELSAAQARLTDARSASGMVSKAIYGKEAAKRKLVDERKQTQSAASRT